LHPIDKGQAVATLGQSAPQIVLMPDPAPSAAVRFEVELPLGQIEPWPEQPRKQFKDRPLAELAESMATLVQVQPILVRPFQEGEARTHGTSKYQIVDGERRWRSACLLKATAIKAIVVHPRDALEQHRMSVIANMHQEPHSHYELALAVIFQYDHGRSALEITADFSKKSPTWAYSYLRLKALVPELFELLNPEVPEGKQISFGQARILAEVKKEMQVRIWAQANQEGKAHGQRGILLRLQELAAENLSEESQFGRERKRKSNDRITRPVSRAIAAVLYNARMLVESAARFKNSLVMQEPADRAKVAGQVRGAAEQLLEFSRQIVG
jgi:ParB family chromosome partitioning protein